MVLSPLLRDFAVNPLKARRNRRDVRLGVHYRVSALARHLQSQVGGLSSPLPDLLLALRRLRGSPRLYGIAAAGRRLRDRGPVPDRLLFSPLPGDPAVAWTIREAEPPARLHLRCGAGQAWLRRGARLAKHQSRPPRGLVLDDEYGAARFVSDPVWASRILRCQPGPFSN